MSIFFAILSNLMSAMSSLVMLVLLLAGGANASPGYITMIKWMMWGILILTICCVAGSVLAMNAGRHWFATGVGFIPMVAIIVIIIVMVKFEV